MNFESIVQLAHQHTEWGVAVLAFLDACISPILPDIVFIPASLANPKQAINLALIATLAATLGSFAGYFIGHQFSDYAQRKVIPPKNMAYIRNLVDKYGVWAVFWGAMAPIPYKIVAISAGVLRLNFWLFTIATILGRAKRFLMFGIPIYWFGPSVLPLVHKYMKQTAIVMAIVMIVGLAYWYYRRRSGISKRNLTL